jgi:putative cell wall-binding protein/alpha-tubulin suppressor-like RCC1 family protein
MRVTTRWSKIALFAVLGVLVSGLTPVAVASAAGPGSVWTRVAGADRYETAAAVSKSGFPGGASAAVVASGELFPDGLTATYLAGQVGGPVLLTRSLSLPAATVAELTRLHVSTVYVAGGTAAVSVAVADQLATLRAPTGQAVSVVRLAGADRYATAAAIAARFPKSSLGMVGGERVALLASGTGFADALSGSAAAAGTHLPLLLTRPDALSPQVLPTLQALGVSRVMVLGGTDAISGAVAAQLTGAGLAVTRLGGADRVATATLIASWELGTLGFAGDQVAIARGDEAGGGVDALSLGAFIGAGKHPLLLADSPSALGDGLLSWLRADTALTGGVVAGGPAAISDSLMQELSGIVGGQVGSSTPPPTTPPPTTPPVVPPSKTTATTLSTGGSTTVRLGNVTVVAAPGAIASGQTLTLARSTVARTEASAVPSLIGGPLSLTSSQGQPQGPVTITFSLQPGQLSAGSMPLVLHQDSQGGEWYPEPTILDSDGRTVTVTIDHFSALDLLDRFSYALNLEGFSYAFGRVVGNRTDASIQDCIGAPNWVDLIAVPTPLSDLNAALWACPKVGSNDKNLILHVVNNRGYMQVLNITGATVDAQLSHWGTSLEQTFALAGAAINGGLSSSHEVFLAGGATADIVIHRPVGPAGQSVTVDIAAAPHTDAVLAGVEWTLLKKLNAKLNPDEATTLSMVNCAFDVSSPVNLVDVTADFKKYQDCVKPLLNSAGIKLLPQLDTILTADGIGQKLIDGYTDEQYPAHLLMSLIPDPALTTLNVTTTTTLPAAVVTQPYTATLTATGGTAPFTWSVVSGSLPAGLSLSTAGSISGTPSTPGTASFTVTVHDSTGATATAPLTLDVTGSGTIRAGSISAGGGHSCAVTIGGAVKCWGYNAYGGLGDGTTTGSTTPVDVVGLGSGVASVSAGADGNSCAVTTGGAVKCWGRGWLGDGSANSSTTPVGVVGLGSGVASVSVGEHTCAVTIGGAVKCWGQGNHGELGNGTKTDYSATPVDVVGLGSGVAAVSAGGPGTCALTTSGAVKCWGDGSATPVDVVGLGSGVAAVSGGASEACAVTTSGAVKCWGFNSYGQLGDGTTTDSATPVDVVGLGSGVTAVSVGGGHTCAVTIGGAVKCWGMNYWGELGDGTTTGSAIPVDVVGLGSGVAVVSAGVAHSCAVTSSGAVKCWGESGFGALGNGTTTDSTTPVAVVGLP